MSKLRESTSLSHTLLWYLPLAKSYPDEFATLHRPVGRRTIEIRAL
jgi:hypothetical protein